MKVSEMAQAASFRAEHGLPGKHSPIKCTVQYTHGIPTGSLIWALVSKQILRIHWLKGLALDVPPHSAAGVLEDSTGLAQSGELAGDFRC